MYLPLRCLWQYLLNYLFVWLVLLLTLLFVLVLPQTFLRVFLRILLGSSHFVSSKFPLTLRHARANKFRPQ